MLEPFFCILYTVDILPKIEVTHFYMFCFLNYTKSTQEKTSLQ